MYSMNLAGNIMYRHLCSGHLWVFNKQMLHSVVVFSSCKAQAWGTVTNTITCPKWSGRRGRWVHGELFCSASPWAHLLDSVFSARLHAWRGGPALVPWLPSGTCLYSTCGVLCHHGYYLTPWRLEGGMEKEQRDGFSFGIVFISTWCCISPPHPEQNHVKIWNDFGLSRGLPIL